jgi:branched-chain amino acid transport system permease protein
MTTKALSSHPVFSWKTVLQYGFIAGVSLLYVCLVGMVEAFDKIDIIYNILSLGIALLIMINLVMGFTLARRFSGLNIGQVLLGSLVMGLVSSAIMAIFVVSIEPLDLRNMFVNASPALVKILTFNQESMAVGLLILTGLLTVSSLLGAIIRLLPPVPRHMIVAGLVGVLVLGMLEELLNVNIFSRNRAIKPFSDFIFAREGLSAAGAIIVFVFFAGLNGIWATQGSKIKKRTAAMPAKQRQTARWVVNLLILVLLFTFPLYTGSYIHQIAVLVGLYILMGMGLNIDVGFAGLLDLGFVGFFAIGAYTVALLTSTSDLGLGYVVTGENSSLVSFWVAVPIAIAVSGFAGMFLGIPVLRMRGDYLAIVTLGFAEIIRILVLSDFLRPVLGGAQGILNIPNPTLGPITIKAPGQFYYLIVIGCIMVAFVAWRLINARLGRNWMAMREDEDVAEAVGINLTATKLLAFSIGACFAGLSGAIFAAQLGSVFPHSFNLQVSIQVLSLIIVGGMGSIPGVIVGALVLVGLPELLREFAEYRLLIYGMLLIVMMLVKPEGLWPSEARRRELHAAEPEESQESQTGQGQPVSVSA